MQLLLLSAETSSAIVDVVALIFLAGFAILGFTRGFVKTFVSIFGTVISLLFAVLLAGSVASFLESELGFATSIADGVKGVVNSLFGEKLMSTTLNDVSNEMFADAGLGGLILTLVLAFKNDLSIPTDVTLSELICPTISYYVVMLISILLLFILFKILMFLLGELVQKMHSISIVRHTDKLLGLILGFVSGITHAQLIFLVISIIPIDFVQNLYLIIQQSSVVKLIESINIYSQIMSSLSIEDVVTFVKSMIK